ncbi:lysis protein [Salmonella enterica]|nr:lysis protein [Salmonella enterica]EEA1793890.1 lysis protein [Salmonella enterica subsp. enterica serovar Muenchen]
MNYFTVGLIAALGVAGWTADHYYRKAVSWRDDYRATYRVTRQQAATIMDMQTRQRDVAALDAKYTKELADAQNQIDALERDVAAGRRRLYVNATCSAVSAGKTTSTPGVDDGTGPRLNPTAERNYYTLRKRIEKARKQIDGLQSYIKSACQ